MAMSYNNNVSISIIALVLLIYLGSVELTNLSYSQIVGGINMSKIPGLDFEQQQPQQTDQTGDGEQQQPQQTDQTGDGEQQQPQQTDQKPLLDNIRTLVNSTNTTKANDVKIGFTATVTQMEDRSNMLNNNVKIGDTINGEYAYKISTQDTNPDVTVGDYYHKNKAYGIVVRAGNIIFQTDPKNVNFLVEIVNRDTDHYLLRSYNNLPLPNSVPVTHISWQLDDETAYALSSDSLKKAPTPPILQNWKDLFGLTITGDNDHDPTKSFFIRAHVNSVNIIT